jgi:hypothetical protein
MDPPSRPARFHILADLPAAGSRQPAAGGRIYRGMTGLATTPTQEMAQTDAHGGIKTGDHRVINARIDYSC